MMDEQEREVLRVAARTLLAVADCRDDDEFTMQLIRIAKDATAPAQKLMTRERTRYVRANARRSPEGETD